MDLIKEAFKNVKEDMDFLFQELQEIKRTLSEITTQMAKDSPDLGKNPTINNKFLKNSPSNPLKSQISLISTGNQGVPTNQQTNQQTNQHPPISRGNSEITNIHKVSEILSSLDELKKEVRFKFKKLTNQEMLIFSTIYQLEEEGFVVDYNTISNKLNLSEISIRDYVRKITKKGIPLNKLKENNKKIVFSIPQDLKKIASLNTIIQLREL
tara:strand:- start:270 stop:902 length:633 start_codon:yes stop_codon:yes gene_type:complete